jgi:hypothetical protein
LTKFQIHLADCFDWLRGCPAQTIHAVCTDPPYGLIEFSEKELSKLRNGRGGVWRLPPNIGGHSPPLWVPAEATPPTPKKYVVDLQGVTTIQQNICCPNRAVSAAPLTLTVCVTCCT